MAQAGNHCRISSLFSWTCDRRPEFKRVDAQYWFASLGRRFSPLAKGMSDIKFEISGLASR